MNPIYTKMNIPAYIARPEDKLGKYIVSENSTLAG